MLLVNLYLENIITCTGIYFYCFTILAMCHSSDLVGGLSNVDVTIQCLLAQNFATCKALNKPKKLSANITTSHGVNNCIVIASRARNTFELTEESHR